MENQKGLKAIKYVGKKDGDKAERFVNTNIGYGMITGKVQAPPRRIYPKEDLEKLRMIVEDLKQLT